MRKAGYNGMITEALRKRIKLTRYQSTLFTMHYSDYVAYVKSTRGSAPVIAGAKPVNHWFGSKTFQFQNLKNLVGVQRKPKVTENLNILVVILHHEEKTETLVQTLKGDLCSNLFVIAGMVQNLLLVCNTDLVCIL